MQDLCYWTLYGANGIIKATHFDRPMYASLPSAEIDLVAFGKKQFDTMMSEWNRQYGIKIDEQDWLYIVYRICKSAGMKLSWADCSLAIVTELPPILNR